ncbi:MAG: CCA tRNA nucleotidyltransferase [Bacteroidales bacterium]|jgi:poly(A) polymerase|nr:CCA tRNA nucleotidyltransferase [Bacteroidales bacterium]
MNLEDKIDNDIFRIIGNVADSMNLETYVVGGFVRDSIMGRKSTDIDIVTIGSGIELAQNIASVIPHKTKVTVFKNFGTAMIHYTIDDKLWQIEFVGARKESYRKDSRKPIVEDGTLEDDQNRRDFTINAMAISLNEKTFGLLLDPFDGVNDIKRQIIRTPLDSDITFSDDPLRMLRCIRFACQLDFSILPSTFDAITRNKERIKIISQERITEELNKMILSSHPSDAFRLLDKCGLLEIIFPEIVALKGVESVGERTHKDNFKHTLEVLDNVSKQSNKLFLRWAAILHDIAKPLTKRYDSRLGFTFHGHEVKGSKMVVHIFRRFKLPLNDSMKYVQKLVFLHLRPIALVEDEVTDSAVRRFLFEAGDDVDDLMILCHSDITSKNMLKKQQYIKNLAIVKQKMIEIEEKDKIRNFKVPVTGEDIMEIYGLSPCIQVGILKDKIKDAILDGELENDREKALDFLYEQAKALGLKKKNE